MNPQPLRPLHRYPHMAPAESALWTTLITANPWPGALVEYDVRVGSTPPPPPALPQNILNDYNALYMKRIDAVVCLPSSTLAIEVKPRAGISAIGQALCYSLLLRTDHPQLPEIIPTILTDEPQPDTKPLCAVLAILLIDLGPITHP